MAELSLIVADPAGLHARPAAKFVQAAARFQSRIVIRDGDREADAKSLIALLGLTIRPSSEITLSAEGPDADAALAALSAELSPYRRPGRLTARRRFLDVVPDHWPRSSPPRPSAPPSSSSSARAPSR